MPKVSEDLRREAGEAFHAYEELFINRILRWPGMKLDAQCLHDVLDSGDEH